MFPDLTRDDVFRIETRRLWLRWPRARDAGAILRLASERVIVEATARIPHPLDRDGTDAFLIEARRSNSEGVGLVMAVTARSAPDAPIGLVSITPNPAAAGPHLGYWLGRPSRGQGLMSEAAAALVDAYFGYAGGPLLTSAALIGNPASRRVLEKCGFRHDGSAVSVFPGGDERPVDTFRLERAVWRARVGDAFGQSFREM